MGQPFFVVGTALTRFSDRDQEAAQAFAARRGLVCEGAIEPDLLGRLMAQCERATWRSDAVEGLGHRRIEQPARVGGGLSLLLKRPQLLRWLETVAGCGRLGDVQGRVHQTEALAGDGLDWHDDRLGPRRLAVTVNLGDRPYRGGAFELRDVASREIQLVHHHVEPGDALIFEVARRSEHRVMPLTSGGPRRVYAGWFMAAEPV